MGTASPSAQQRSALALCSLGLLAFGLLAWQLAGPGPLAAQLDPMVSQWLMAHRRAGLTSALVAVTEVHSTVGIDTLLACVVALLVLSRRRWREALWLLATVQSSMLLNVVLKLAFARQRPQVGAPLVHLASFGFPSGHALAATVFWGALVSLLPPGRRKGPALAGAAVLVLLVGLSRIYLGAHFLTDVLAGAAEGLVCIGAWQLLLPGGRTSAVRAPQR